MAIKSELNLLDEPKPHSCSCGATPTIIYNGLLWEIECPKCYDCESGFSAMDTINRWNRRRKMETDYISRNYAVENMWNYSWDTEHDKNAAIHLVRELVPAANVVSRDCFNRILTENDTMREQLAAIGKKPGDSMNETACPKFERRKQ